MKTQRDGNRGVVFARLDAIEALIKLTRKALSDNDASLTCIHLDTIKMHVDIAIAAGEAMP